jgi:hypothetical protein
MAHRRLEVLKPPGGMTWPNFRRFQPKSDRLLNMADWDTGISVEMLDGLSESEGWAVVYRVAGMPRKVIAVYFTRAHAEAAAEQIQEQIDSENQRSGEPGVLF